MSVEGFPGLITAQAHNPVRKNKRRKKKRLRAEIGLQHRERE